MPTPNPSRPNDPRKSSSAGLPVAKLLPPAGGGAPRRPTPKPPPPPDDSGFEVVDDTAPSQSSPTADSGFEVVDDEPPPTPRKKKSAVAAEDGDDAPRTKKWSRRDEDDEDVPRKKKKRRRRLEEQTPEEEEAERERHNAIVDWGVPLALMLFGFGMMMFASLSIGKKDTGMAAVSTGFMLISTLVFALVSIPITIVGLMAIGMLLGIEYGTPLSAIRNLAAICFIANGIMFLGSAFLSGLGGIIVYPIAGLVTFGLFMTLFRLDVWETWVSLIGLNLISKALSLVLFMILIGVASKAGKSGGFDKGNDPDDAPPGWNQKNQQWNQPPQGGQPRFDPGDDN
jgi:hypothetical protein